MGDRSWFTLRLAFNGEKKKRLEWKKWRWKATLGARVCSTLMLRPCRGGSNAGEGHQLRPATPTLDGGQEHPHRLMLTHVSPSLPCWPPGSLLPLKSVSLTLPDSASASSHCPQNNLPPQPTSPRRTPSVACWNSSSGASRQRVVIGRGRTIKQLLIECQLMPGASCMLFLIPTTTTQVRYYPLVLYFLLFTPILQMG